MEEKKTSARANKDLWRRKKACFFFFPTAQSQVFLRKMKEKQPNYITDFSIHMDIFVSKSMIVLLFNIFKNYYLII